MDKETLSNYGWIVICVLVLSVMIALATPFGNYVRNAIKSTTTGLNDTSNKAMSTIGLSNNGGNDTGNNTPSSISKFSVDFYDSTSHIDEHSIVEYEFEQGMTWEEWVNSKYNIPQNISGGYVVTLVINSPEDESPYISSQTIPRSEYFNIDLYNKNHNVNENNHIIAAEDTILQGEYFAVLLIL